MSNLEHYASLLDLQEYIDCNSWKLDSRATGSEVLEFLRDAIDHVIEKQGFEVGDANEE